MKKFLIMAGGTGGHVFPALAIAEALIATGHEVHWLGTPRGIETEVVTKAKIPLHYISIEGLRGKGFKSLLLAPWRLTQALIQALKLVKEIQPDVVLGMGGFASGPGGLAAWILKKPLYIHEQNAAAGLTNRLLARVATKVFCAFPHTFADKYKAIVVGNPIRKDLLCIKNNPTEKRRMRLFVMGGSLGAVWFNQEVPKALRQFAEETRPEVLHQTGKKHMTIAEQAYSDLGVPATITPFIEDVKSAYEWADVVLCRAGAMTVSELMAAGRASILVPYPHAVDDHQTKNGLHLVAANAAVLEQQRDLDADKLYTILAAFENDRERLTQMSTSAKTLYQQDSTKIILGEMGG